MHPTIKQSFFAPDSAKDVVILKDVVVGESLADAADKVTILPKLANASELRAEPETE